MKKISIALFFLACLLPSLLLLSGYQSPNYEKRALAEMPKVANGGEVNLAFPEEFETYLSDRFGLKPLLVSAYSALQYYLLGDSANDKVIAGRDGWLYMSEELGDYQRATAFSDAELERLCRTLALQQEYLRGRGIAFLYMTAPNKSSIYGQYMPGRYARLEGDGAAAQLEGALEEAGVAHADLFEALTAAKGEGQLYHKKDTHWNELGAWVAYREIMGQLALQAPAVPDVRAETADYTIERTWYGDLETMLMPAFRLTDEQTEFNLTENYTTARPMRSPEDIDILTRSEVNGLDVLMFRDSFANALLPFLSNRFGTVHYTRAVPYDYSMLEDGTDIVILEIVERNLRNLLERAPLMPAPQRAIGPYDRAAAGARGEVRVEPAGEYTRIFGWALPEPASGLTGGRVYVELYNDGGSYAFEPFPILDESFIGSDGQAVPSGQAVRDGGFSMLLDGGGLASGTYGVRVLVQCGDAYSVLESEAAITR